MKFVFNFLCLLLINTLQGSVKKYSEAYFRQSQLQPNNCLWMGGVVSLRPGTLQKSQMTRTPVSQVCPTTFALILCKLLLLPLCPLLKVLIYKTILMGNGCIKKISWFLLCFSIVPLLSIIQSVKFHNICKMYSQSLKIIK